MLKCIDSNNLRSFVQLLLHQWTSSYPLQMFLQDEHRNTESEALISPSETQGHHVTSTNTEQLLWTQPTAMWNFLKEIIGGGRAGERLRWRSPEPRGLLFSCKRVSPGRTETASCNCWRSANWEQLKSNTRHVTRRALFSRSAWPADAQHSSKSRETPLF